MRDETPQSTLPSSEARDTCPPGVWGHLHRAFPHAVAGRPWRSSSKTREVLTGHDRKMHHHGTRGQQQPPWRVSLRLSERRRHPCCPQSEALTHTQSPQRSPEGLPRGAPPLSQCGQRVPHRLNDRGQEGARATCRLEAVRSTQGRASTLVKGTATSRQREGPPRACPGLGGRDRGQPPANRAPPPEARGRQHRQTPEPALLTWPAPCRGGTR